MSSDTHFLNARENKEVIFESLKMMRHNCMVASCSISQFLRIRWNENSKSLPIVTNSIFWDDFRFKSTRFGYRFYNNYNEYRELDPFKTCRYCHYNVHDDATATHHNKLWRPSVRQQLIAHFVLWQHEDEDNYSSTILSLHRLYFVSTPVKKIPVFIWNAYGDS